MGEEQFSNEVLLKLRACALGYPQVTEGASCVNRAFKAKSKNFLFLGEKEAAYRVMLKVGTSLGEVQALAESDERYSVGKTSWVTLNFGADDIPPAGLIEAWIDESYRLLAPKLLLKELGSES